ncbi:MAG: AraC family transcriptional regulator [Myxococcota bacterium]
MRDLHAPLAVLDFEVSDYTTGDASRVEAVHAHGVLGLVLGGDAQFWMGTSYRVRAGDVLLVPDGMPHFLEAASEYHLLGLGFCVGCLDPETRSVLTELNDRVRRGASAVRHLPPQGASDLEGWLRRLEAELAASRPQRPLAEKGLLAMIATEVARADSPLPDKASAGSPAVVADALRFITEHSGEPISLADVAQAVGRAPGHVATLVRQHTGRTVGGWIVEGRMAVARQLLLHSDAGLTQVADRVGYASVSHFHRAFKREHGMAPGAWRSAHALANRQPTTIEEERRPSI